MRLREAHVGEHVGLGTIHEFRELLELWPQLISDQSPLRDRGVDRVLREHGVDRGEHHLALPFAGVRERVAQEVNFAALPARTQHLRCRCFQTLVGVRDHELHAP